MRILPTLLCSLLVISSLSAETVTLIINNRPQTSSTPAFSEQTITLAEGDIATVSYLSNNTYLDVTIKQILVRIDANDPNQANLPVIAGPATIRALNYNTLSAGLATITIKRAGEPAAAVPTRTVVIPDDGSGDREVRLESSTDMVNWTTTQPGLFTTTNTARFFRVRVTKVP